MGKYTIESKHTKYDAIVKFETNHFLVKNESFEFNNIDEAKESPLAQALFYLPFVKTVYIAQNFIAVEKYNTVEWKDVENEVSMQIEDFLNSGKTVVKVNKNSKKVPATVYAESTPNPKTMKFVSNKRLVLQTTEYKEKAEAVNSPFALELFNFPIIKQVFIDHNFISLTKTDAVEWTNEIAMQLREFIRAYLEDGKTIVIDKDSVLDQEPEAPEVQIDTENLDDISKEIISILEEYVKPAVASDGGNIKFESYNPENKQVKVILQGACSGCPSSTLTLKNGIENMLKEMMHDKVQTVEAING